jgi:DNA relaxase NicK
MFTMGSRTSERYARVYDRRGPTRFELECKAERAAAVWALLMGTSLEGWSELIRGHVRDFCDFARPWWEAIMGGTARAMLRLGSFALATAESARAWLRKQAAPWLAALVQLDGGSLEFVSELLSTGRHRYRRAQMLALEGLLV